MAKKKGKDGPPVRQQQTPPKGAANQPAQGISMPGATTPASGTTAPAPGTNITIAGASAATPSTNASLPDTNTTNSVPSVSTPATATADPATTPADAGTVANAQGTNAPASGANATTSASNATASAGNANLPDNNPTVLSTLQEIVKLLKTEKKTKDGWDKFGAISTFVSSVVIALIGIYVTQSYNFAEAERQRIQEEAQNKLTEMDVLSKFMPYLGGENEAHKRLAVTVISKMGSVDLAASVAEAFPSSGTLGGLNLIAANPDLSTKEKQRTAVATQKVRDLLPNVTVRFVTDRTLKPGAKIGFGTTRDKVSYGAGVVSIPVVHRAGQMERHSFWLLADDKPEEKFITVRSIAGAEESKFFGDLKEGVSKSANQEITVYVHGAGIDFETAVIRSAQMIHDIRLESPAVLFSWPSAGATSASFAADQKTVDEAMEDFASFLGQLTSRTEAKRVNVIGHGLGCDIILKALAKMNPADADDKKPLINQLVLIAADVDRSVFSKSLGPIAVRLSERVTQYTFKNDKDLLVSRLFHKAARLGDSSTDVSSLPGVETVNVESDQGSLGSTYYADANLLLLDLSQTLQGIPASKRPRLRKSEIHGETFWIL